MSAVLDLWLQEKKLVGIVSPPYEINLESTKSIEKLQEIVAKGIGGRETKRLAKQGKFSPHEQFALKDYNIHNDLNIGNLEGSKETQEPDFDIEKLCHCEELSN